MVKGMRDLERRFAKIPQKIVKSLEAPMEKQGKIITAHMRNVVPEDQGNLKRSIRYHWGEGGPGTLRVGKAYGRAYGRVGVTIKAGDTSTLVYNKSGGEFQNARLQEFGTQNMPANPYFYPVWRALRSSAKSAMTRAITKAIKES